MNKKTNGIDQYRFWNWDNSGSERTLYLYGTIAEASWMDDDMTPEMFRKELNAGTGPVTIWLSSPGGDVFAASQIYSMLLDYKYPVTVKIDGIAASAASVIAMAGTTVLMAPTACMMIHDPVTMAVGNESDMEKAIDMLNTVKDSIVDAYELRTNLDRKTLAKMMSEETWMDSRKAIELGFADGILEREEQPVSNSGLHSVSGVLFSQRAVDTALVNKISEEHDVPVKPLYSRLEALRG